MAETLLPDKAKRMLAADVKDLEPLDVDAAGVNQSFWVTMVDKKTGKESIGIYKPAEGEEDDLREGVQAGTYWLREAAVSRLDELMGGTVVVPTTVHRKVEGREGSVQAFVPHSKTGFKMQSELRGRPFSAFTENRSVRRLAMLDIIIANSDRHSGNIMWAEDQDDFSLDAVAIDNGLTIGTKTPYEVRVPIGLNRTGVYADLVDIDDESHKQIKRMKPGAVARICADHEIEYGAARALMVRIEALKENPEAVSNKISDRPHPVRTSFAMNAVRSFVKDSFVYPEDIVSEAALKRINSALDAVY